MYAGTFCENNKPLLAARHCVKSVRIWSFYDPYFRSISTSSARIRGNTDLKNSGYAHFSHSVEVFAKRSILDV